MYTQVSEVTQQLLGEIFATSANKIQVFVDNK